MAISRVGMLRHQDAWTLVYCDKGIYVDALKYIGEWFEIATIKVSSTR